MRGRIITDWSKVNFESSEGRNKLRGAFQYFMSAIDTVPELRRAYQAFTTKGDFPDEVKEIIEKFHAVDDFDEGYKRIFDIRDYTGTKKSGFKMLDVSSGLSFKLIKPGEKVKVNKVAGDEVTVSFDLYGGALGWLKSWIQDAEYWLLEDTALEFRNQEYKRRALAYYSLLDALPASQDLTWQSSPDGLATGTRGYLVDRDVATINKACEDIISDLENKGYGVGPNTRFFLAYPITLQTRITRALNQLNQPVSGTANAVNYNVEPIATSMLNATDKYYVGVPGKKLKGGNRMNLTLANFEKVLAYTEGVAGFARYAGILGDVQQVKRLETA